MSLPGAPALTFLSELLNAFSGLASIEWGEAVMVAGDGFLRPRCSACWVQGIWLESGLSGVWSTVMAGAGPGATQVGVEARPPRCLPRRRPDDCRAPGCTCRGPAALPPAAGAACTLLCSCRHRAGRPQQDGWGAQRARSGSERPARRQCRAICSCCLRWLATGDFQVSSTNLTPVPFWQLSCAESQVPATPSAPALRQDLRRPTSQAVKKA